MSTNNTKVKSGKGQKTHNQPNVLESLKDVGSSAAKSIKQDLFQKMPGDFMDQLFGPQKTANFSGELRPGESLEFNPIAKAQKEERDRLKNQIAFERRLHQEETIMIQKKSNELRIQLKAITDEVLLLAKTTTGLEKQVEIATMQAPIEPGVYHVIFFENILNFIVSFRKKIQESTHWLAATNKRAQKKNYWSSYKKHGSKFLLSGEHYLTRSAG